MAYRRPIAATELPTGILLTRSLVGIGMNFAVAPLFDANIEDLLLAASLEGLERDQAPGPAGATGRSRSCGAGFRRRRRIRGRP